MLTAVGVVAFVVALLVSVTLHEAGHFVTARHYGMKATQFFVGFGPTLWSRQKGETEYGIKAIPAGGFVKIVGMTTLDEVDPGDEDRAFWRQPAGRRTVVLSAGSFGPDTQTRTRGSPRRAHSLPCRAPYHRPTRTSRERPFLALGSAARPRCSGARRGPPRSRQNDGAGKGSPGLANR